MTKVPDFVRAEPIPEDIIATLRQEAAAESGIAAYPDRLARRFKKSKIAAGLAGLAVIIEPVDRALGMEESKPVAKAFHTGELIGLRVAASCLDDVDAAFSGIGLVPTLEGATNEDKLHTRQLFANEIVNIGDEAFAAVEDTFMPLFDDWEQQLVPDVRHQRMLRTGFGIPMAYLFTRYERNRTADLAAMESQISAAAEDGFDWDALLVQ